MYRKIVLVALLSCVQAMNEDIELMDGVKLVGIPVSNNLEDGRSMDTPLYRVASFLRGHELHIQLPNFIEKERINQLAAETLKAVDEYKDSNGTGRGKGGGGAGAAALLGLMFAKTIGAAGIGGLGLLTMKALAVSALALMLSAIVGVKKLASHDDHDDHQVIYAGHGHGHHRRRRDVHTPLPYRAWTEYQ